MSPVTGLARLPGRILGVFIWGISARSPAMKNTVKMVNQTYIVGDCHSFVYFCNFTNKANLCTPKV